MKTHEYTEDSWQNVTDEVKKHFGWKVLTQESAKTILALYIKGVRADQIIKQLEEENGR